MSDTITIAAPPTTSDVATAVLASILAQSGVITDFNEGSQIRTLSEAFGSVEEMQSIAAQALAFQAALYSALAMYEIQPLLAQPAVGTVTFSTGSAATQTVVIPSGTIIGTVGGIQFTTTAQTIIAIGATTANAPVQASTAGASGNVTSGTITQILSGIAYGPLGVTNASATAGGSNAEAPTQTLARFAATVAAIPAASPVALANACIGVVSATSSETVQYATCYEPWIAQQAASETVVPGYTLFVDNGSGAASSALLTAVATKINPLFSSGYVGYRDAGVPYSIVAVTPLPCSVTITGTATATSLDTSLDSLAETAGQAYFATLQFAEQAEQAQLNAAVANATAGSITGLTVTLLNGSGTPVSILTAAFNQRVVPTSITVTFS